MAKRRTWWGNPALRQAITLTEGGGDIIRSIFADGTDGFYFDFSKTDRLFQNLTNTPADDPGENIYLGLEGHDWAGKTLDAYVAAQTERLGNPSFDSGIANWSGSITPTADTGTLRAVGVGVGSTVYNTDGFAVTSGRTYRLALRIKGDSAYSSLTIGFRRTSAPSGVYISSTTTIPVTTGYTDVVAYLVASSTVADACFIIRFGGTEAINVDSASVKEITGNHGLQATTSAQPKWQTGGLARFDGSDDTLLTTLVPGTAMTLMAKFKPTTANGLIMGSRGASADSRCYLGTDANGKLGGSVGAHNNTVIFGGSDIRGTIAVGAQTFDGATVKLYLNASEVYSGAQSGAPTLDTAIMLGAVNVIGTASAFMAADAYHFLAIKKALTAAQITAITNLWGTS